MSFLDEVCALLTIGVKRKRRVDQRNKKGFANRVLSGLAAPGVHEANAVLTDVDLAELSRPPPDRFIQSHDQLAIAFTNYPSPVDLFRVGEYIVLRITWYVYNVANFDLRHYSPRFHKTNRLMETSNSQEVCFS
jgi:hypothetical protein